MKFISSFLLLLLFACSGENEHGKNSRDVPSKKSETSAETNHPVETENEKIISIRIDPARDSIRMYWKDASGQIIKTLKNLNDYLAASENRLLFAMNAGMYMEDFTPLGLYIENGKTLRKMNTKTKGYGNFYMQPGGVFYITNNRKAGISRSSEFSPSGVRYATQSGPMLVINSRINSEFRENSTNTNIRNGVGILENGEVIMAISVQPVSFYEFAAFFKDAGCINALYLDGGISGAWYPEKDISPVFNPGYGVMIAVVEKKKK